MLIKKKSKYVNVYRKTCSLISFNLGSNLLNQNPFLCIKKKRKRRFTALIKRMFELLVTLETHETNRVGIMTSKEYCNTGNIILYIQIST